MNTPHSAVDQTIAPPPALRSAGALPGNAALASSGRTTSPRWSDRARCAAALVLLSVAWAVLAPAARAWDDLKTRASWSPPAATEVKSRVEAWLAEEQVADDVRAQLDLLWADDALPPKPEQLLDHVGATIALVRPETRPVVELCGQSQPPTPLPEFAFLSDEGLSPFVRHNLRLLYGRWLAQHELYDESVEQVAELKPEEVVDPASLLFYQSVGHHKLLNKDACLAAINKLLENEKTVPHRYAALARLMAADIKPLEVDSLDEIARLMGDIRRRLNFGRAGTKVRKQEDDVIAKLDKMIEEMEQQQQQQQQSSGSSGGNAQSAQPAQDSAPLGGTGEGNVDPRNMAGRTDWGNLPFREREKALQQIGKELPDHYREAIEAYFQKLAREGSR